MLLQAFYELYLYMIQPYTVETCRGRSGNSPRPTTLWTRQYSHSGIIIPTIPSFRPVSRRHIPYIFTPWFNHNSHYRHTSKASIISLCDGVTCIHLSCIHISLTLVKVCRTEIILLLETLHRFWL